ncbi:MAG: S9 family peptidase [Cytophagales bacterium]|nr:S9 family peptidase [Cytophagales bacterium]
MKHILIILILNTLSLGVNYAQHPNKITLEDIFRNNKFKINSIRGLKWMNDGNFYTALIKNPQTGLYDILKYSTRTGDVVDTIVCGKNLIMAPDTTPISISSYQFNNDESKVLISSEEVKIYRRSSKAINYVYDLNSSELTLLVRGDKQSYATFSPDGIKVGFVRANNLYIKDLSNDSLIQVTGDGKKNKIINGSADWVYEEELSMSKAFFWSPDGKKIAYLKFDESEVQEYNMQKWNGLYPEDYRFKYPKAGEKNSIVSVHVCDLTSKQTIEISTGNNKDVYIARLKWLPVGSTVSITKLNRLQNRLDLIHADVRTRKSVTVYTEEAKTYIDIDQVDDLTYLDDGESFILSSERSGYKHFYHYAVDGDLIAQITNGKWGIADFYGIDVRKNLLYFSSTRISSMERHLYVSDLSGKKTNKLSIEPGMHAADFSRDFKFYIDTHSSVDTPLSKTLYNSKGKKVKTLAENDEYLAKTKLYGFAETEFLKIGLSTGDSMNAYIMKPADFDETKKYPLLMYVYGGPGSQNVLNRWNNNHWHHYLTQQGYIIACVDNRGTGGKGRDFQHVTYKQLGKIESEDQITAAKYFGRLPYIDENRIGIWGWSYGGYMSSLAVLLGNEVFKAAIAVAPVTNWRFYDTIYTERYLRKPQDNPSGYDDYSPNTHADKLQGAFLLIHGTGDDNVHFQNAVEFQDALIKANKQFDSFYYPDRNHGIYGGNTHLHLYTMMTNFILQKL